MSLRRLPRAVGRSKRCAVPRCKAATLTPVVLLQRAGPESAVKRLIATIDSLQLQQAHAEERRLAAERDTAAAHSEAASLKAQLHASLLQLADLDDREDAVRAALDARLLKRGQAEEQLRWVLLWSRRLATADACCCIFVHGLPPSLRSAMLARRLLRARLAALRLQTGGGEAGDDAAAEAAFSVELAARQALAAELQQRLRQAGVTDAALAQLCSTAAAHSTAAGGQQQRLAADQQGSSAGEWLHETAISHRAHTQRLSNCPALQMRPRPGRCGWSAAGPAAACWAAFGGGRARLARRGHKLL